jgi:radical SAM/Cys-rich protein
MEAGPQRKEIMDKPVMEACLDMLRHNNFAVLDITGGAPEMNPHFRWFLQEATGIVPRVTVRTNLVILLEPKHEDLPQLYRNLGLDVVCSLPHYTEKNTDKMRGDLVFRRSIEALCRLNALGYGIDPSLPLNLVYNPGGAFLPAAQQALERDFHERLKCNHDVTFTRLLAITNNPVGRFGAFLTRSGNMPDYMEKLYNAFNADTLSAMMCRGQISVAYDGRLYDCDFNQAVGLPVAGKETVFDWRDRPLAARRIRFGQHCYACTAGQGSGCGGATT